MQIIGPAHFDDNEAFDFTIRTKVRAVPCPGGAQLTDDQGDVTASYGDDCYVVEGSDGQHKIVSRYVFDGLYEADSDSFDETAGFSTPPVTSVLPVAGEPTPEPAKKTTAKKTTAKKTARGGRR